MYIIDIISIITHF